MLLLLTTVQLAFVIGCVIAIVVLVVIGGAITLYTRDRVKYIMKDIDVLHKNVKSLKGSLEDKAPKNKGKKP